MRWGPEFGLAVWQQVEAEMERVDLAAHTLFQTYGDDRVIWDHFRTAAGDLIGMVKWGNQTRYLLAPVTGEATEVSEAQFLQAREEVRGA